VNIASRLEAVSSANRVLISAATAKKLDGDFKLDGPTRSRPRRSGRSTGISSAGGSSWQDSDAACSDGGCSHPMQSKFPCTGVNTPTGDAQRTSVLAHVLAKWTLVHR
jgi:hypothetical protein